MPNCWPAGAPPCLGWLACTRPVHKSRARKLRAPPASRHHLCLSTKDADAQVVHRCKCIFCLTKMQEDAGAQVLASTTHRSRRSPQCTRSSCSRNDPSGKCPCERTAWTSCKLEAKTPGLWTGHPVLTFSSEVFLLRQVFFYICDPQLHPFEHSQIWRSWENLSNRHDWLCLMKKSHF